MNKKIKKNQKNNAMSVRNQFTRLSVWLCLIAVLSGCASTKNNLSEIPEAPMVDLVKAAQLNAQLSIVYSQRNMLDRAKEKLLKAKKLDATEPSIYYAEGLYYQNLGESNKAENAYQKGLEFAPKDFHAYNFYAQYLCGKNRQYQQANQLFKESIGLSDNSNLIETFTLYGRCLLQQNQTQLAENNFKRAINQGPKSALAHWALAQLYYKQQEYGKALAMVNRYIELKDKDRQNIELKMRILTALNQDDAAAALRLQLSSNLYQ